MKGKGKSFHKNWARGHGFHAVQWDIAGVSVLANCFYANELEKYPQITTQRSILQFPKAFYRNLEFEIGFKGLLSPADDDEHRVLECSAEEGFLPASSRSIVRTGKTRTVELLPQL